MESTTPLQARLLESLKRRGWSQRQLASRAGLGAGAVNDIINHPDRSPRGATLQALELALGEPAGYLSGAEGSRSGPTRKVQQLDPQEIEEFSPSGALSGLVEMLRENPDRWAAYSVAPSYPSAAAGTDGANSDIALIDRDNAGRTGSVVFVTSPLGDGLRFFVEPYLIGISHSGRVFHEIAGAGTQIIGALELRISWS